MSQLTWLLVGASAALIAVGTIVTGTGRHPGDSKDVPRIPLDWTMITQLHADLAWIVVALAVALWFVLQGRRRAAPGPAPGPVTCSWCCWARA